MKKAKLLSFMFAASVLGASAQFSENFEGVTLTNGTGSLPAGFTQANLDGLTPATNVNFMGTNAWVVRDLSGGGASKAATSTSWYAPAGTSNDWMITPQITVPATSPYLFFKAMAPDAQYPDGYVVKISTAGNATTDFTTDLLTVAAAGQAFETKAINLSAYAGQQIYLAWVNNNNDDFLLYIDDIEVKSLPANDVQLSNCTMERFIQMNQNTSITGTITNWGASALTSVTIDWNDGTAHPYTFNGLNVATGGTYNFTHPTAFNKSTADQFNITVTASSPNGGTDSNPTDNIANILTNTVSSVPNKAVVIEEGTGTWCGYCPRGAVAMEYMYDQYTNGTFIGIAVHNADPMTVTAYDAGANFGGYPSANVDRVILDAGVSNTAFNSYYGQRINKVAPVGITLSPTVNGTALTAAMTATFVTKLTGDFRFAGVIVRDSMNGTASGWEQTNYYNGGSLGALNGAGHDWTTAGDPVPANQMWYNHVGIALLGGYSGAAGSVPGTVNDQQVVNYSFNYTLPTGVNLDHLYLVGMILDNSTGAILNANMVNLGKPVSVENADKQDIKMNVYPNPTVDFANIAFNLTKVQDVNLTIYTMEGKSVYNQMYKQLTGSQILTVNTSGLAKGNYLVSVAIEGQSFIQHLIVK